MRSGSLKVRPDGPPLKQVGMGTAVSFSVPPQPLINMVNPLVRRILRSPLHSVLDRRWSCCTSSAARPATSTT